MFLLIFCFSHSLSGFQQEKMSQPLKRARLEVGGEGGNFQQSFPIVQTLYTFRRTAASYPSPPTKVPEAETVAAPNSQGEAVLPSPSQRGGGCSDGGRPGGPTPPLPSTRPPGPWLRRDAPGKLKFREDIAFVIARQKASGTNRATMWAAAAEEATPVSSALPNSFGRR